MEKTRDYTKLHPGFAELVLALITRVQFNHGHSVKIHEAVRSVERQNFLYSQGRARPGRRVTNAKGGESMHNFNLAVDLCLMKPVMENGKPTHYPDKHPVWEAIGKEARALGLEWGGDWKKTKDRPHVQMPFKLEEVRKWYKKGGLERVFYEADGTATRLAIKAGLQYPLVTAPLPVTIASESGEGIPTHSPDNKN